MILTTLSLLAHSALLGGNAVHLIRTGEENLAVREELIRGARQSILIATYAFKDDPSARKISDLLCEKAREGVDVRLRLDGFGSMPFHHEARRLRRCGAKVLFDDSFHDAADGLVYSVHEKLLIVDGEHLEMGGSGYAGYYFEYGRDSDRWHDLDARIDGPLACWYHRKFATNWRHAVGTMLQPHPRAEEAPIADCREIEHGEARFVPVYNDPWFSDERPLVGALAAAIDGAESEVLLYAPYFVPARPLTDALIRARRRGLRVAVLTNSPASNDEMKLVQIAMDWRAKPLLEAGVEIRLWGKRSTMHRKGGVIDGKLAYVGSDNLDVRGQNYSSESVAWSDDAGFARELREEILADFALSPVLTEKFREKDLESRAWYRKLATRLVQGLL